MGTGDVRCARLCQLRRVFCLSATCQTLCLPRNAHPRFLLVPFYIGDMMLRMKCSGGHSQRLRILEAAKVTMGARPTKRTPRPGNLPARVSHARPLLGLPQAATAACAAFASRAGHLSFCASPRVLLFVASQRQMHGFLTTVERVGAVGEEDLKVLTAPALHLARPGTRSRRGALGVVALSRGRGHARPHI